MYGVPAPFYRIKTAAQPGDGSLVFHARMYYPTRLSNTKRKSLDIEMSWSPVDPVGASGYKLFAHRNAPFGERKTDDEDDQVLSAFSDDGLPGACWRALRRSVESTRGTRQYRAGTTGSQNPKATIRERPPCAAPIASSGHRRGAGSERFDRDR